VGFAQKKRITKARKAKTRKKKPFFFRVFAFRAFVIEFLGKAEAVVRGA